MVADSKKNYTMKVFQKGQVVIPVSLREKYHIDIGDQIDVISAPNGILLKPLVKDSPPKSLTEQLFGIFSSYASGKPKPTRADIEKATKEGFFEGWTE